MTSDVAARLKALTSYRRRRKLGEWCCLGCGVAIPSPRRTRCPPCAHARRRGQQRTWERTRPTTRQERRRERAARLLVERLEGEDTDLF
ncbi:hypothetical protein LCGC14_0736330 [marine sediment metagenome]|uniref:DUF35 domain-containing protein n=1 Tax=marine sediment metagenome TaxID=412755 RepID=A0A0F9Q809_9ZZZZ